jgi:hypothetical protein
MRLRVSPEWNAYPQGLIVDRPKVNTLAAVTGVTILQVAAAGSLQQAETSGRL